MSEMLYNPYDLIIIKENVIPQENIEEIMLLTNNKDTSQATTINSGDKEKADTNLEDKNLEVDYLLSSPTFLENFFKGFGVQLCAKFSF